LQLCFHKPTCNGVSYSHAALMWRFYFLKRDKKEFPENCKKNFIVFSFFYRTKVDDIYRALNTVRYSFNANLL